MPFFYDLDAFEELDALSLDNPVIFSQLYGPNSFVLIYRDLNGEPRCSDEIIYTDDDETFRWKERSASYDCQTGYSFELAFEVLQSMYCQPISLEILDSENSVLCNGMHYCTQQIEELDKAVSALLADNSARAALYEYEEEALRADREKIESGLRFISAYEHYRDGLEKCIRKTLTQLTPANLKNKITPAKTRSWRASLNQQLRKMPPSKKWSNAVKERFQQAQDELAQAIEKKHALEEASSTPSFLNEPPSTSPDSSFFDNSDMYAASNDLPYWADDDTDFLIPLPPLFDGLLHSPHPELPYSAPLFGSHWDDDEEWIRSCIDSIPTTNESPNTINTDFCASPLDWDPYFDEGESESHFSSTDALSQSDMTELNRSPCVADMSGEDSTRLLPDHFFGLRGNSFLDHSSDEFDVGTGNALSLFGLGRK